MTKIPYLDKAWNVVKGCSKCSPGCVYCYAAKQASTGRLKQFPAYQSLADKGEWTGKVFCDEAILTAPLTRKKPAVYGASFMGDLFHPDVPDAFLDKVFAVMALCQQHTFVLCTKRAKRMREYLTLPSTLFNLGITAVKLAESLEWNRWQWDNEKDFPLPNVHLGVTVESSDQLDRACDLLQTPAAHRWLSIEPMLSGVGNLSPFLHKRHEDERAVDSIVLGCESGLNRRPCKLDWVRQVRDDCEAVGVNLYVKQLVIGGKVETDVAKFPDDLRSRELPWQTGNKVSDDGTWTSL